MDALMGRTLAGCVRVGFAVVLGLALNVVEYRPNRADAEISVNTVVIRGFPAPNRVMQILPAEESGISRYPRHMELLYLLAVVVNFWFSVAIIRIFSKLAQVLWKTETAAVSARDPIA